MNFQLEKQIHFWKQAGMYTSSPDAHKFTKMKKSNFESYGLERPAKSLNIYYNAG